MVMQQIQTSPQRVYRSHPYSERVRAVALYKEGFGSKRIGRIMEIDDSMVRSWIRKYRAGGIEALRPYVRESARPVDEDALFESALRTFSTTLEPVASITRRYRLDYHSFKYRVERYHPDLVLQRESLRSVLG